VPAAVLTLIGKVNSTDVASPSLGLTFAAETLLYNPPRLRRQVSSSGAVSVTLAYAFLYKPQTHNKFWRAATQAWEPIFKTGVSGAVKVYELGDFSALIG
jgi:hypothetical protein